MRIRPTLAVLAISAAAAAPFAVTYATEQAEKSAQTEAKTATGGVGGYSRDELEQIVIETIMKNPEVILKSVEMMQVKQQQEEEDRARQAVEAYGKSLFEDKDAPIAGNPDGDVVVVEFFDYNCGYCKRSLATVTQLVNADKNVKVIFKDYPVIAPSSEPAARAALAMNIMSPDRYFDFHSALFRMNGQFDEDNLAAVAEGMGLDKEKFLETMQSDTVTKRLDKNRELAAKLGLRGVPVFIVGTELFPGAIDYDTMKEAVDKARATKS